jgi:hypothetical protein
MAICAAAQQSPIIGTTLGVPGSIAGAFAGYKIRHSLVEAYGLPDFGIASAEDIVAIGGGADSLPDVLGGLCSGEGRSKPGRRAALRRDSRTSRP